MDFDYLVIDKKIDEIKLDSLETKLNSFINKQTETNEKLTEYCKSKIDEFNNIILALTETQNTINSEVNETLSSLGKIENNNVPTLNTEKIIEYLKKVQNASLNLNVITIRLLNTDCMKGMLLEFVETKENIMTVQLCSIKKSSKVVGVYSNSLVLVSNKFQEILVKSETEPKQGELTCSSDFLGIAIIQDDDLVHSYTVGLILTTKHLYGDLWFCYCKLFI